MSEDQKLHGMTSDALRKLGRDDLADQLQNPQPAAPQEPVDEGEAFLQELRDARHRGKTVVKGLLDE